VVIANGPSLKAADLARLRKYPTFGSNMIYRLPFEPTYYSVVDRDMLDTCLPLPDGFKSTMFVRAGNYFIKGNNPIYPVTAAGFSDNIDNMVVMGGSVTYVLLQIAYYMGFTTILMLGLDHNYPSAGLRTPGSRFIADEYDADHFQPADGIPYFKPGGTYNAPELERLDEYLKWANECYVKTGRKIVNLTENSKTDAFEKMGVDEWLAKG
jgi:hypothetical protein